MPDASALSVLPQAWWPFLEAHLPGLGIPLAELEVTPIHTGGSDRLFFRLTGGGVRVILNHTPEAGEFTWYVEIGSELYRGGVPVPAFLAQDRSLGLALLADAGSCSLHDQVKAVLAATPPGQGQDSALCDLYLPVLKGAALLHHLPPEQCPTLAARRFDYETWRWETDYFRQRFLVGYLGWSAQGLAGLDPVFEFLARRLEAIPQVPVHRDFQSQNLLLSASGVSMVDFQGARLGPWMYDLASLLKDPYVDLDFRLQSELWSAYLRLAGAGGEAPVPGRGKAPAELKTTYELVALQRLMQALGAYGFLGLVKGRRAFLAHIPTALGQLEHSLDELIGAPAGPGEESEAARVLAPLGEVVKRAGQELPGPKS